MAGAPFLCGRLLAARRGSILLLLAGLQAALLHIAEIDHQTRPVGALLGNVGHVVALTIAALHRQPVLAQQADQVNADRAALASDGNGGKILHRGRLEDHQLGARDQAGVDLLNPLDVESGPAGYTGEPLVSGSEEVEHGGRVGPAARSLGSPLDYLRVGIGGDQVLRLGIQ